MKKYKEVMLAAAMVCAGWAQAQEFKVSRNTGRLEIHLNQVTVEGYGGNEIVFTSSDGREPRDKRAEGLQAINGLGLEDNTGLGINVTTKGDVVEARPIKQISSDEITIKVPKGMIVAFEHESQYAGEGVFRNLENEIEISVNYNSIRLENITGPVTLKTIYGAVEADFSTNVKGPISIVSIYGHVDVTLPLAIKADLKLDTSYGEIFVAPEFKMAVDRKNATTQDNDRITGKVNGGGIRVDLTSNYDKIYLRKK